MKLNKMKNRISAENAKPKILEFLNTRKRLYVTLKTNPQIEIMELFNFENRYYIVVAGFSNYHKKIKTNDVFYAMICSDEGTREKTHARICGDFKACEVLDIPNIDDKMYKKMIAHKSDIFEIKPVSAMAILSMSEMFDLDEEFNTSFAKFAPNGKERFENSRHIGMEYLDRQVIFNTIIENETYYTLTNINSNKIDYIKNGGICKIFDGLGVEFETKIEIIDDPKEIFGKLNKTNNSYFKSIDNLVGLKFKIN